MIGRVCVPKAKVFLMGVPRVKLGLMGMEGTPDNMEGSCPIDLRGGAVLGLKCEVWLSSTGGRERRVTPPSPPEDPMPVPLPLVLPLRAMELARRWSLWYSRCSW